MTVQPTRVDEKVYQEFKDAVLEVHGGTRGTLKTEVERALAERTDALRGKDSASELHEINEKIDAILDEMGVEIEPNENPPTHSRSAYVRARADVSNSYDSSDDIFVKGDSRQLPPVPDKPRPNAPTDEKANFIALVVLNKKHDSEVGGVLQFTPKERTDDGQVLQFAEAVDEEYSFNQRASERLREASVERAREIARRKLDAEYPEGFPKKSALAWGDTLERLRDDDKHESGADETLDELDAATVDR